jgi:hypothetical protein
VDVDVDMDVVVGCLDVVMFDVDVDCLIWEVGWMWEVEG